MKVKNIKDINKFFEIVDSCTGKVELVTGEGDRLNLKSKLCQMIGLTKLIQGGTIDATLLCTNAEDDSKMFRFALYGEEF